MFYFTIFFFVFFFFFFSPCFCFAKVRQNGARSSPSGGALKTERAASGPDWLSRGANRAKAREWHARGHIQVCVCVCVRRTVPARWTESARDPARSRAPLIPSRRAGPAGTARWGSGELWRAPVECRPIRDVGARATVATEQAAGLNDGFFFNDKQRPRAQGKM